MPSAFETATSNSIAEAFKKIYEGYWIPYDKLPERMQNLNRNEIILELHNMSELEAAVYNRDELIKEFVNS